MKKITLLFLLIINYANAQIPSINETSKSNLSRKEKNDGTNKFPTFTLTEPTEKPNEDAGIFELSILIDNYVEAVNEYKTKIADLKKQIRKGTDRKEKDNALSEIKKYTNEINILNGSIDSTIDRKNAKLKWFPSSGKTSNRDDFFTEFFNETSEHTNYLNNLSFVFGSTTVQSELISDYMGPLRLSFGSVVNADTKASEDSSETEEPTEEEQQNELKRLINGGGNFYLNGLWPIHAYKTLNFSELTSFNGNLTFDYKGISDDVETSNVKALFSITNYVSASSDNKKFNFFLNSDYSLVYGSKDFRNTFGFQDFLDKPALVGKAIFGVTLNNLVRLSITTKTISNYRSLISEKVMVGIQLLN